MKIAKLWRETEDVMYAAAHYRDGVIPNESAIKATVDYAGYKAVQERALPKFKYYAQMIAELRDIENKDILFANKDMFFSKNIR